MHCWLGGSSSLVSTTWLRRANVSIIIIPQISKNQIRSIEHMADIPALLHKNQTCVQTESHSGLSQSHWFVEGFLNFHFILILQFDKFFELRTMILPIDKLF